MRRSQKLIAAGVLAVLMVVSLIANVRTVSAANTGETSRDGVSFVPRTLKFPAKESVGALFLVPSWAGNGAEGMERSKPLGKAIGTVKVFVVVKPSRWLVMLKVDNRVMRNPSLLKQVSPEGIEALKMGLMAMDNTEDGLCDQALKFLPRFTDLELLDVDQSDSSDIGLANVKSLKKLKKISMCECRSNGACFKDFCALPELNSIIAERCWSLNKDNLSYLAGIRKLDCLQLRWCNLTDDQVKPIGRCSHLASLGLSRNGKITGDCLKYLVPLKDLSWLNLDYTSTNDRGLRYAADLKQLTYLNLKNTKVTDAGMTSLKGLDKLTGLDLRGTKVSIHGLAELKGLKLENLSLPETSYTLAERSELKKCFPKTKLMLCEKNLAEDVQLIYSPIPEAKQR